MIQSNNKVAFNSDYFTEISQDTLVDLLKIEIFHMKETEILKTVHRWVCAELKRKQLPETPENKQAIFEPFKCLIRFKDLSLEEISESDEIECLLTTQDMNSLLLHQINESRPLKINYESPRKKCFLSVSSSILIDYVCYLNQISTVLKSNRSVIISSMDTLLETCINNLQLTVRENDKFLDLNIKKSLAAGRWSFKFLNDFRVDPRNTYRFEFGFEGFYFDKNNKLSNQFILTLEKDDKIYNFSLNQNRPYSHCIKTINFHE